MASSKEPKGQGRDCDPGIHGWDSEGPEPSETIDKIVYVYAHHEFFRKKKIYSSDQILKGIQNLRKVKLGRGGEELVT